MNYMPNSSCKGHDWIEVPELYALIRVAKKPEGTIFYPSQGIPVIVHVCKKCSEIKLFSAIAKGKFQ